MSQGFPGGSDGRESACSAGDVASIPGLGRSPGEVNGNSLQCSCLENSMDRGAWWAIVHRGRKELDTAEQLAHPHLKSQGLSWSSQRWCHPFLAGRGWKRKSPSAGAMLKARASSLLTECVYLGWSGKIFWEKAMAPHSSTPAWKIPWMEEPGRRQSMGSLRVRHDWAASLALFAFMHWRRKWQPTPVFLPGESQGRGSLVGCRLWVTQSRTRLKWLSSSREDILDVAVWKLHCAHLGTTTVFRDRTSDSVHVSLGACAMLNQSFFRTLQTVVFLLCSHVPLSSFPYFFSFSPSLLCLLP